MTPEDKTYFEQRFKDIAAYQVDAQAKLDALKAQLETAGPGGTTAAQLVAAIKNAGLTIK